LVLGRCRERRRGDLTEMRERERGSYGD
jgi:hypothetical protein